ncbi:hypothetical protein FHX34_103908 [Actinoplanes teichomyceticus]|uniref:Uncharacterized protein n=1 Tax=Actinoplanes teichomyceticus TaxID=1867 RepID=A0A561WBX2_ACTTI|nr:hypothetical protein FHX34_103908 [Actinoplanes teichomyceticus]GIF16457.1 hypothetical protein Ate01nite_64890 [Actinoplanes teichomyceticus]
MPRNHLQAQIVPADRLIRPMIGPGGMTHEQAHTQVQTVLDRLPQLAEFTKLWHATTGSRPPTRPVSCRPPPATCWKPSPDS